MVLTIIFIDSSIDLKLYLKAIKSLNKIDKILLKTQFLINF